MKNLLLLFLALCMAVSACKDQVSNEVNIYRNDFENNNLTGVNNGVINIYNGSAALGPYNNSGFILTLKNIPKHSLITISFDLFIHDDWRGQLLPDGADLWQMLVDKAPVIYTTFSNLPCTPGNICPPQSYPANYPSNYNNPRTGAFRTDLPGVCSQAGVIGGSTQYRITKTIKHTDATLLLECIDQLNQTNHTSPKCDKSWSVDNINIKAIAL